MGTVLDPRLTGFNATLSTSPNYGTNTYQQYGVNILQQKIDSEFEFASDVFSIQEEETFGELDWSDDFTVRITHIISNKGTGEKLGDDFRNIIFPDLSTTCVLGQRYSFDSNYWIAVNTDKYKYPTISSVIRRCNNVLKNYDTNGVLHTEPCIIDYQVRSTDFDYNNNIILTQGDVTVIVQGNAWTKTYFINQRFMFGGQAYKCTFINNFQRTNTLTEASINIIRMVLTKVEIDIEKDDVLNNIPNSTQYTYSVAIDQDNFQASIGGNGTITASVFENGVLVSKALTFTSLSPLVGTIASSTGVYSLLTNGSVTFKAVMVDNPLVFDTVTVTVTATVTDVYQVVVTPNITEIYEGDDPVIFSAFLLKNNVQQVATVIPVASGMATDYYTLTVVDGNHFTITNKQAYNGGNLLVTCTSGAYSEILNIQLKGAF